LVNTILASSQHCGVIKDVVEIVHNEHGLDRKMFVSRDSNYLNILSLSFKLEKVKPFIF
jgi:hypothetical protein